MNGRGATQPIIEQIIEQNPLPEQMAAKQPVVSPIPRTRSLDTLSTIHYISITR